MGVGVWWVVGGIASSIGWDPKCFGHGSFPRTSWRQSLPKRLVAEEGEKGSVLHSVSVLSARISELADIVSRQQVHEGRCHSLLRWLRRAVLHADVDGAWSCSVGVTWHAFRQRPLSFEEGRLDEAVVELGHLLQDKRRQHAASCRQAYAKWVDELIVEPRRAHRWTKLGSSLDDDLWKKLQAKQAMPHELAMATRQDFWKGHWQQHREDWPRLQLEIQRLREDVQKGIAEEVIDLVDQRMLDDAVSTYGVDKARGLDAWSTTPHHQSQLIPDS